MSDQSVTALITALISLVGTMFTGYMAYLMARLNARADVAATAVEQVKTDLTNTQSVVNGKLDRAQEVAEKTHTLVNSAMGAQLRLCRDMARRLADRGDPRDIEAAEAAEKLLAEHEAKQARVDKRARSQEKG